MPRHCRLWAVWRASRAGSAGARDRSSGARAFPNRLPHPLCPHPPAHHPLPLLSSSFSPVTSLGRPFLSPCARYTGGGLSAERLGRSSAEGGSGALRQPSLPSPLPLPLRISAAAVSSLPRPTTLGWFTVDRAGGGEGRSAGWRRCARGARGLCRTFGRPARTREVGGPSRCPVACAGKGGALRGGGGLATSLAPPPRPLAVVRRGSGAALLAAHPPPPLVALSAACL